MNNRHEHKNNLGLLKNDIKMSKIDTKIRNNDMVYEELSNNNI